VAETTVRWLKRACLLMSGPEIDIESIVPHNPRLREVQNEKSSPL